MSLSQIPFINFCQTNTASHRLHIPLRLAPRSPIIHKYFSLCYLLMNMNFLLSSLLRALFSSNYIYQFLNKTENASNAQKYNISPGCSPALNNSRYALVLTICCALNSIYSYHGNSKFQTK